MKKRYLNIFLCTAMSLFILITCADKPFKGIYVFGMILFLALIAVIIAEICIISTFKSCRYRKVVLSYKDLKKYMSLAPERYNTQNSFMVYYMEKDRDRIHTRIYFSSLWSNFRYLTNSINNSSNKYMKDYLEEVNKDIDVRAEADRKINEALESQKKILSRISKENGRIENEFDQTLSL